MIRALTQVNHVFSVLHLVIRLFLGSEGVRDFVILNNGREKKEIFKDSGKTHETYKDMQVSSKGMKLSRSCHCQNQCASRVCVAEKRQRIFDYFYKLADHDCQNKYQLSNTMCT